MAYYMTSDRNCKTFNEAADCILSIPADTPISIHQYEDGEYCVTQLVTTPVQHGQVEWKGEVILAGDPLIKV